MKEKLDALDYKILSVLVNDAKTPYAEMASAFGVSNGTIHVRIEKMRQAGVITGTAIHVNEKLLGYDVCCFIGINLRSARDYPETLQKLQAIDEVVEAYYTTGQYSIFVKLMAKNIEQLQHLLIEKIQSIETVRSTETLISLQNPIHRNVLANVQKDN